MLHLCNFWRSSLMLCIVVTPEWFFAMEKSTGCFSMWLASLNPFFVLAYVVFSFLVDRAGIEPAT
jgi:hypothetical protein